VACSVESKFGDVTVKEFKEVPKEIFNTMRWENKF
jgi:hypothetical protein